MYLGWHLTKLRLTQTIKKLSLGCKDNPQNPQLRTEPTLTRPEPKLIRILENLNEGMILSFAFLLHLTFILIIELLGLKKDVSVSHYPLESLILADSLFWVLPGKHTVPPFDGGRSTSFFWLWLMPIEKRKLGCVILEDSNQILPYYIKVACGFHTLLEASNPISCYKIYPENIYSTGNL